MSAAFFAATEPALFAGADGSGLAFRWYDKDRMVGGKRMEDHLRFAVCYWHSFAWPGGDPFGGETFLRPWMHAADPMAGARQKADVAFEMFRLLDVPFFTFHDADVAPEGENLAGSIKNLEAITDIFAARWRARRSGCSGAPPTSSRTAATWRARRPIPIRRSSPTPAARSARRWRRPTS